MSALPSLCELAAKVEQALGRGMTSDVWPFCVATVLKEHLSMCPDTGVPPSSANTCVCCRCSRSRWRWSSSRGKGHSRGPAIKPQHRSGHHAAAHKGSSPTELTMYLRPPTWPTCLSFREGSLSTLLCTSLARDEGHAPQSWVGC